MLPRYSNGTYHPSILGPSVVTVVKKERLAQTLDFAPRYSVEEGIDLYIEEL